MDEKLNQNNKKHKAIIYISIVLGIIVVLFIGYIIYADIVSNSIKECIPQNNYCQGIWPFEKTTHKPEDCIYDLSSGRKTCITDIDDKPIIYLYPETTTKISVSLGYPEKLTASYPKYDDGWEVIAEPSGRLTDIKTGRELYSLYWEGKDSIAETTNEGFIVAGKDVTSFLEEKLAILGLNEREAEEFIIYWLPQLEKNQYNYIRFASQADIEKNMPLKVNPTPDTTIRVLMITKPLDAPIDITEQALTQAPDRKGFTVVEWGGTIISDDK